MATAVLISCFSSPERADGISHLSRSAERRRTSPRSSAVSQYRAPPAPAATATAASTPTPVPCAKAPSTNCARSIPTTPATRMPSPAIATPNGDGKRRAGRGAKLGSGIAGKPRSSRPVSAVSTMRGRSRSRIGSASVVKGGSLGCSLDDLAGGSEESRWDRQAEFPSGFQIDDELKFGRLINRNFARFGPFQDLVHVIGHAPPEFVEVPSICHQPARLHVFTPGIHRRQAASLGQLNDQATVGDQITDVADHDRVRFLLRDFRERALNLGRGRLLERRTDYRDLQSSARLLKYLLITYHRACGQKQDLGYRGDGFLEHLEALSPDLEPRKNGDAGDGAAGPREARRESRLDRVAADPNDWQRRIGCARRPRDRFGAGDDYVRIPVDCPAGKVGKALGAPLAGIPLNAKVLALDIAQSAQFFPERLPEATSGVVDACNPRG